MCCSRLNHGRGMTFDANMGGIPGTRTAGERHQRLLHPPWLRRHQQGEAAQLQLEHFGFRELDLHHDIVHVVDVFDARSRRSRQCHYGQQALYTHSPCRGKRYYTRPPWRRPPAGGIRRARRFRQHSYRAGPHSLRSIWLGCDDWLRWVVSAFGREGLMFRCKRAVVVRECHGDGFACDRTRTPRQHSCKRCNAHHL